MSGSGGYNNDPCIGPTLIGEDELLDRVGELGRQIAADYEGRPPLLVGVLKGAFLFMGDLAREIDLPVEFDFMAVSSYGAATQTSGVVRILKDLDTQIEDRHVLEACVHPLPVERHDGVGRVADQHTGPRLAMCPARRGGCGPNQVFHYRTRYDIVGEHPHTAPSFHLEYVG